MSMEEENKRRAALDKMRQPTSQSLRDSEGSLICPNEEILGMAGWGPRAVYIEWAEFDDGLIWHSKLVVAE